MYLCYLDESGTSDIPGNTSHYVLAGLSIPIWHWKDADSDIRAIKRKYWLREVEIHTAWMLRPYLEQRSILDFESLAYAQRRLEVERLRNAELYRLQRSNNPKRYQQTRKNFRKTEAYIHLTYEERRAIIVELAASVSSWGFARLFAECVDKLHFDPSRTGRTIDEQSFEQVVSRFQQFLRVTGKTNDVPNYGLLIHDNNETVARRHTHLMCDFFLK